MQPKKRKKKTVLNLEFGVASNSFSLVFFVISMFFRYFYDLRFSAFFGLNFDQIFKPFENHVTTEALKGQELPNI